MANNGTEYINVCCAETVFNFTSTSVSYSHEWNGVAELVNRAIVDKSRCMINVTGLGKQFWAEAVNTATYIKNCSPHKQLDSWRNIVWRET